MESKSCSQATAANKPATTPSIRRSSSVNNNKIIKRAVTFKAGLLADREVQRYTGPLLSMDQVCSVSSSRYQTNVNVNRPYINKQDTGSIICD